MKPRPSGSHEHALIRIYGLLGFDTLTGKAGVTGKSESLLRAWSDPDEPAEIPLYQAIALDRAAKAATGETPILDVYQRQMEETVFALHLDLADAALDCVTGVGRFTEAIRAAKSPTGPGGHRITAEERRECERRLDLIERHIQKARAALNAECAPKLKEVS